MKENDNKLEAEGYASGNRVERREPLDASRGWTFVNVARLPRDLTAIAVTFQCGPKDGVRVSEAGYM